MGNCCSGCADWIASRAGYQRIPESSLDNDQGTNTTEQFMTSAGSASGSGTNPITSPASSQGVRSTNGSTNLTSSSGHTASESIEIVPRNSGSSVASSGDPGKSTFYMNYELRDEIGVGSTSKCYKCIHKSTGQEFACKVIDKRQVEMKFSGLLDQFFVEIKVLKALNHPNIIRLVESYETPDRIYMVMEVMKGGELFDYVVEKGTLSEEEASVLVRKITSAVAHMHNQNIIHRDLKPENLLLTSKDPKNAEVKLIDFGLAKVMHETVASSFLGTKGYLAPEMLQRHSYDKAIDIWALGVIVFVLVCGCLPFDDDSSKISSESAARKKFALRFPKWAASLSPSAKDLLHNLLEINPKTRYTADQALAHPWVSGKTVQPNNYLQSPCVMGERRNELRSPALQGYIQDTHRRAQQGAAAATMNTTSPNYKTQQQQRARKLSM